MSVHPSIFPHRGTIPKRTYHGAMVPVLLTLLFLSAPAPADNPKEDIKQAARQVGQGFKKGGKAVGHAAKEGGKAVGRGAKTAGKGVAKGAKEAGRGVKEAVK